MKRTQVQFDEETYAALKRAAYERQTSLSAVLRDIVREKLLGEPKRKLTLADFPWIASGTAEPSPLEPISENHDAALVEDLFNDLHRHIRDLRPGGGE